MQTHVNPRIQEHVCLGTRSPTGNVQHLLCEWQHVLVVQPLTHVRTGLYLFTLCSKAGMFSLWMSSKDFSSMLQGGSSEFPAWHHQPSD